MVGGVRSTGIPVHLFVLFHQYAKASGRSVEGRSAVRERLRRGAIGSMVFHRRYRRLDDVALEGDARRFVRTWNGACGTPRGELLLVHPYGGLHLIVAAGEI